MGALDGRVAIITGAGPGHRAGARAALRLGGRQGRRQRPRRRHRRHAATTARRPQQVVDEIKAMGGEAVANADNVADWEGGQRLVNAAVEAFGDLHVLVNNAGILRDRVLVNMTEEEWDAVIHVHLKGHFVPDPLGRRLLAGADEGGQGGQGVGRSTRRRRRACSATRARPTTARPRPASPRSPIIAAQELEPLRRAGQRHRPRRPHPAHRGDARASATSSRRPDDAGKFDVWDPANISPLVAYLATEDCPVDGQDVLRPGRRRSSCFQPWTMTETIDKGDRWTVAELETEMKKLVGERLGRRASRLA